MMKHNKYVSNSLNLITITLLVGGLVKCGIETTDPIEVTTETYTTEIEVKPDGYLMLGFSLPATTGSSILSGSLDSIAAGANALGPVSANNLYGTYNSGSLPTGSGFSGTVDSFGLGMPLKDAVNKNILFAFRSSGVYPASGGNTAINSVNFNVNVADKAFANTNMSYIDSVNKIPFMFLDLNLLGDLSFPAPRVSGSQAVAFLPSSFDKTASTWGKFNSPNETIYTSIASGTTGFNSNMTTNSQYSSILLSPSIPFTNFNGMNAKANVTIAVLKDTDFAAGSLSSDIDTPVNGFAATSSLNSGTTLIVPNIGGFLATSSGTTGAGMCSTTAAKALSGVAGGWATAPFASGGSGGETVTFSGQIWIPSSGSLSEQGLALVIGKSLGTTNSPVLDTSTVEFWVGGTKQTSFEYNITTGGNTIANVSSNASLNNTSGTGSDIMYVMPSGLSKGGWNNIKIVFKNPAAAPIKCAQASGTSDTGAWNLYTTNGISSGTTTAVNATNLPTAATTTFSGSAMSAASGGSFVLGTAAPIAPTRIRFVAP